MFLRMQDEAVGSFKTARNLQSSRHMFNCFEETDTYVLKKPRVNHCLISSDVYGLCRKRVEKTHMSKSYKARREGGGGGECTLEHSLFGQGRATFHHLQSLLASQVPFFFGKGRGINDGKY